MNKNLIDIIVSYRQKDQNGREERNKVKEEGMRNKGKEEFFCSYSSSRNSSFFMLLPFLFLILFAQHARIIL